MKCRDCKHWCDAEKDGNEADGYDHYEGLRFDLHPTTYEKIGKAKAKYCRSPNILFYESPAANQATVVDGSQYRAALITGPEFGCVNFEKADPKAEVIE